MTHFTDPMDAVKGILGMPRDLDYPELVHPEKIDHKAEAVNALTGVSELGLANDEGYRKQELLAEAQVHATLALMEQQRLGNLIALGIGRESREIREGLGLS